MKSPLSSSSVDKKRSANPRTVQRHPLGTPQPYFSDNRPAAIAQRKRQEMVNRSQQVNKALQLQAIANQYAVTQNHKHQTSSPTGIHSKIPIQRVINLGANTTTATQHQMYYITSTNTNVLYSRTNAVTPRPTGLYHKQNDRSTTDVPLYKWTPNARLYRNDEKPIINEATAEQAALKPALVNRLTGEAMNPELSDTTVSAPTIGTVGDNDCAGWATTLREMIAEEGVNNSGTPADTIRVGDQMTHHFPDDREELACSYHSATTVAKDGDSLVTLEAHASKDLAHPEFHIRNGIRGFVNDNNDDGTPEGRGLGDEVAVSRANPATSAVSLGTKKQQFEDAVADPLTAVASPYNSFSMVTQTTFRLQRNLLNLIWEATQLDWSAHAWRSAPGEITAMRAQLNAIGATPQLRLAQLEAVIRIANGSLGRYNYFWLRKEATTNFCHIVGGINPRSVNNLQARIHQLQTFIGDFGDM